MPPAPPLVMSRSARGRSSSKGRYSHHSRVVGRDDAEDGRVAAERGDDQHVLVGEGPQRGLDELAEVAVRGGALRDDDDRALRVEVVPPVRFPQLGAGVGRQDARVGERVRWRGAREVELGHRERGDRVRQEVHRVVEGRHGLGGAELVQPQLRGTPRRLEHRVELVVGGTVRQHRLLAGQARDGAGGGGRVVLDDDGVGHHGHPFAGPPAGSAERDRPHAGEQRVAEQRGVGVLVEEPLQCLVLGVHARHEHVDEIPVVLFRPGRQREPLGVGAQQLTVVEVGAAGSGTCRAPIATADSANREPSQRGHRVPSLHQAGGDLQHGHRLTEHRWRSDDHRTHLITPRLARSLCWTARTVDQDVQRFLLQQGFSSGSWSDALWSYRAWVLASGGGTWGFGGS